MSGLSGLSGQMAMNYQLLNLLYQLIDDLNDTDKDYKEHIVTLFTTKTLTPDTKLRITLKLFEIYYRQLGLANHSFLCLTTLNLFFIAYTKYQSITPGGVSLKPIETLFEKLSFLSKKDILTLKKSKNENISLLYKLTTFII
mgnify:CR=1 FL=1